MMPVQAPALPAARSTLPPPPDALSASLMARVLDEIDHGLILLDLTGRLLHANHPARRELGLARSLSAVDGMLVAGTRQQQAELRQALAEAERGRRSIVELPHVAQPLSLAFIPLDPREVGAAIDTVLVMCSRSSGCETLTMQMFARAKRLTPAEQRVLTQLCAGCRVEDIASLQGVQLSTVRTHIKSLRQKTGASSIREIVRRMACMPQMTSVLRLVKSD